MSFFVDLIILLLLFIALGFSAELVVHNIKYLGTVFKIRLFAFGIILGLITSLPELVLGINATIDGVAGISIGNLFGGILVMLGLIFGISLIFNKKIKTDGNLKVIVPKFALILSPILLGLDGNFDTIDGIIFIGLYVALLFLIYKMNNYGNNFYLEIVNRNKIGKAMLLSISGVLGIAIISHFILLNSIELLKSIQISELVAGILIFSIGTNLPEISIAITSFKKKSAELSLSHILSSSFTNILILGIISLLKPIYFDIDKDFYVLAIFLSAILITFTFFYKSDKNLVRIEGLVLLMIYLLFIGTNILLSF